MMFLVYTDAVAERPEHADYLIDIHGQHTDLKPDEEKSDKVRHVVLQGTKPNLKQRIALKVLAETFDATVHYV